MAADKILTFVDDVFFSDDDAESKAIILALGMFDHLHAKTSGPTKQAAIAMCIHHPTHWILVSRAAGYAKPTDNGYCIAGWPKRKFNAKVAAEKAQQVAALFFGNAKDMKISFVDPSAGRS